MFAYVTVRSAGICLILLSSRTNSEFSPLVPILISPCTIYPHSIPNAVVHTSLVAGYFASFV